MLISEEYRYEVTENEVKRGSNVVNLFVDYDFGSIEYGSFAVSKIELDVAHLSNKDYVVKFYAYGVLQHGSKRPMRVLVYLYPNEISVKSVRKDKVSVSDFCKAEWKNVYTQYYTR